MPQINLIQPGQPVASFAVDGTTITVAGVVVEASQHQADSTEIVEIRQNGSEAQIGGAGAYLAHIAIPPAQYSEPLVDEETGEELMPAERLPLDHNTIVVTLWPTA